MRVFKKAGIAIAMSLTLAMISPTVLPNVTTMTVQAATVKLNKTKSDIKVGESITLKVTGASKDTKVLWTSSKSSVATVSKAGKVTGKAAGTATITATVNKKKYNCTVTVKKAIENKIEFGGISFNAPNNWTNSEMEVAGMDVMVLMPENSQTDNINVIVQKTGEKAPKISLVKKNYIDGVKKQLESLYEIKNFKSSTYKSKVGEILVVSYSLNINNTDMFQKQYYIFQDQYLAQVTETHVGKGSSKLLEQQSKKLIDSIKIVK